MSTVEPESIAERLTSDPDCFWRIFNQSGSDWSCEQPASVDDPTVFKSYRMGIPDQEYPQEEVLGWIIAVFDRECRAIGAVLTVNRDLLSYYGSVGAYYRARAQRLSWECYLDEMIHPDVLRRHRGLSQTIDNWRYWEKVARIKGQLADLRAGNVGTPAINVQIVRHLRKHVARASAILVKDVGLIDGELEAFEKLCLKKSLEKNIRAVARAKKSGRRNIRIIRATLKKAGMDLADIGLKPADLRL